MASYASAHHGEPKVVTEVGKKGSVKSGKGDKERFLQKDGPG